jgi:hypothetical protein
MQREWDKSITVRLSLFLHASTGNTHGELERHESAAEVVVGYLRGPDWRYRIEVATAYPADDAGANHPGEVLGTRQETSADNAPDATELYRLETPDFIGIASSHNSS